MSSTEPDFSKGALGFDNERVLHSSCNPLFSRARPLQRGGGLVLFGPLKSNNGCRSDVRERHWVTWRRLVEDFAL